MINLEGLGRVATGSSYGAIAHDEHARKAVQKALSKVDQSSIGSVLLFLTGAYAHKPQNAIKEAVKAAGTPLVFGCCAMGLLSDQEWLLDVEGAVAMVFPRELGLQPLSVMLQQGVEPSMVLTLSSPNAAAIAINSHARPQTGAIASDEFGHGPFSVWQSGRIVEREFMHAALAVPLQHHCVLAHGVRHISPTMQINRADRHRLFEIGEKPSVDNLLRHLPQNMQQIGLEHPYNLLCAVSENNDPESIQQGHYDLHHVVSTQQDSEQEVCLSGTTKAGRHMFWALRDAQLAQLNLHRKLLQLRSSIKGEPEFAFMFANISRGPEFYDGPDRDLEIFKEIFPHTPLLGFYSNGEIAPGHKLPAFVHRYSTVVSLFTADN
ncbi:MAG: small ligand-binding sensory domain FIST [Cryomorphaceae bacterium]|jgi:small ligand-binding sensory domain FIST